MEDAEKKWQQIQLETARAWANLDIAVEMVEENKKELNISQYAEIKSKINEQQKMIQDTLLTGLAEYRLATGKSGTDDVVESEN
jgi:16S rRNA G527 N7-methylase RsmG